MLYISLQNPKKIHDFNANSKRCQDLNVSNGNFWKERMERNSRKNLNQNILQRNKSKTFKFHIFDHFVHFSRLYSTKNYYKINLKIKLKKRWLHFLQIFFFIYFFRQMSAAAEDNGKIDHKIVLHRNNSSINSSSSSRVAWIGHQIGPLFILFIISSSICFWLLFAFGLDLVCHVFAISGCVVYCWLLSYAWSLLKCSACSDVASTLETVRSRLPSRKSINSWAPNNYTQIDGNAAAIQRCSRYWKWARI